MKGNLLAWEEPDKPCKVNFQPFSSAVQREDKRNTEIRTNNNLFFLEASNLPVKQINFYIGGFIRKALMFNYT